MILPQRKIGFCVLYLFHLEQALPIIGPELSVYGTVLPTALKEQDMERVTVGILHERVGDEVNLLTNNPFIW